MSSTAKEAPACLPEPLRMNRVTGLSPLLSCYPVCLRVSRLLECQMYRSGHNLVFACPICFRRCVIVPGTLLLETSLPSPFSIQRQFPHMH